MNRKEGLILLWLVFAAILGGSFYGVAQEDEKIERKISYARQPPAPPAKVKGEETEIVYDNPFFSKNPDKKENYEVYLDKFVVWTTDTTAVYSILGNSDFVISHRESEPGIHRMECSVGDPKLGKRLRAKLKKEPKVIRVSNFYYSSQYESEYRPEDYVTVRLKNAGDSIRLKEIADSIGGYIRCSSVERGVWELFLGRCKSTAIEIANELYEVGFTEWADAGIVYEVFLDFSYDPEVSKQWYLYNTKNISIPPANKYTDLEVSSAWN
ncbi:MAG: hypothetical protein HDS43_06160 [Bacteroides sp.]|nr:hypothetical protein [Bacteroides sp.]